MYLVRAYRARYTGIMDTNIPSATDVRGALARLRMSQIHELSRVSGVPWTTLRKIRDGETPNPRLETVRQFLPHVAALEAREAA